MLSLPDPRSPNWDTSETPRGLSLDFDDSMVLEATTSLLQIPDYVLVGLNYCSAKMGKIVKGPVLKFQPAHGDPYESHLRKISM